MNSRYFFLSLLLGFTLGSCAAPSFETAEHATGRASYAEAPRDRPGLGTRWGESRKSAVGATSFQRATPADPLATAAIYCNDRAGIEAMAAASQLRRV